MARWPYFNQLMRRERLHQPMRVMLFLAIVGIHVDGPTITNQRGERLHQPMRVMVFLAIVGIHVDGPLAVLNGEMVGIHLAVGRRSVAVEHRVASVQFNGLQANKTTTFKSRL